MVITSTPLRVSFFGGGTDLLGKQTVAAFAVLGYSFIVAFVLGWAINKTIGFRVTPEAEIDGIDLDQHAETAYEFDLTPSGTAIEENTSNDAYLSAKKQDKELIKV